MYFFIKKATMDVRRYLYHIVHGFQRVHQFPGLFTKDHLTTKKQFTVQCQFAVQNLAYQFSEMQIGANNITASNLASCRLRNENNLC